MLQPMLSALRRIEDGFAIVAGVTLALVMILVSADSLGRYLFNAPIDIQFELTQNHLLVMATVLAYSWGVREGAHMRVEFVVSHLPAWMQRLVVVMSSAAAAAIFGGVTYYSGIDVIEAWRNNEMTMGVIDWPVVYSRIWIPLGGGLLTLRLLAMVAIALTPTVPLATIYGEEHSPEALVD